MRSHFPANDRVPEFLLRLRLWSGSTPARAPVRISAKEERRGAKHRDRLEQEKTANRHDRKNRRGLKEHAGIHYGPSMRETLSTADRAAPADAPVLILGETGVGKEELARRIHEKSGRKGAFVPVHPASIPEPLFESELFGHEKGAFTGAHRRKAGLLETADGGTLFIDELGDIPPLAQIRLLRVLQDKRFMRVGGVREIHSDFRLISATNQDLKKKVREGTFREDLYYRVAVVPLRVPPLRRRGEDLRRLAEMFYARYAARYQRAVPPLTGEDLDGLCALPWPGNVRELKSFIARAVLLYDDDPSGASSREGPIGRAMRENPPERIMQENSPERITRETKTRENSDGETVRPDLLPTMRQVQRQYIQYVLTLTRGKIDGEHGALAILGMKRSNLYAKIREYGLDKVSLLYGRQRQERD
jgi:DNA-binding NtrC family response regulator